MLGTAHVEFYRNIPLIIQLFAIYLLITELLPMSTEALHAGSWALLSKAGLQVAVPNQEMLSALAALVAALLTLFLVRLYCRQTMTDLAANLAGLGAAVLMGIVIWVLFGFVGGWSKPVINGFAIEGGAALSPEFLALWLGLTLFTSAAIAEIVRAGILGGARRTVECGQGARHEQNAGGELCHLPAVHASGTAAPGKPVHESHEELVAGGGDRLS